MKTTRLFQTILRRAEKAIYDHGMIREGDRILVGVSGGPDSLSLLEFFKHGFPSVLAKFEFHALHVDPGFDDPLSENTGIIEKHFQSLGVPYTIIPTSIAKKVLDPDAKKNPCFICSYERRKLVYDTADRLKCNKIAYGHHKDDIVETLLINVLFGRKIETMWPIQKIFEDRMTIIRPFALVEEELLKKLAREQGLPNLKRLCPMDGKSRRQTVKNLIRQIQENEPHANIRENIFKAQFHVNMRSVETT
jgi:tRNA 2-thiocytidine biosynthesis protein TtcA